MGLYNCGTVINGNTQAGVKRGQVCGALKDPSASFTDPIPVLSSTCIDLERCGRLLHWLSHRPCVLA